MSAPAGAVGARPARRPTAAAADRLRAYLPALAVFVGALVIWEVVTGGPGRRVLPPPSRVLEAFAANSDLLTRSAMNTYFEALGGLAIGTLAGVLVAFSTARWVTARDALLPVAIAANSIPIIAIAPILNNWFGVLNPVSKMMMAALLVFFPVMINVTRGLVNVQPAALELMRSYATSEWTVLRKVRVPNMLPFLFTALKVGTTLAFIGAIVGEYFGGTSEVLGRVILTSMSSGRFDVSWAGIVLGAAGALFAYLVVVLVERLAIPWHAALRSGEP
ncbi:MAG TPA: ABC transporter permease subunit [Candidatus Limnocylindria bacterium]|nr:ABC transporter permease subunit [Candidatus Limnocylindria bacterium]